MVFLKPYKVIKCAKRIETYEERGNMGSVLGSVHILCILLFELRINKNVKSQPWLSKRYFMENTWNLLFEKNF
jgi:hypothetical protein